MLGYAKYVAARPRPARLPVLRHAPPAQRRERESLGEPTWLREIEAPTTLADLEAAGRTTRMAAVPALPAEMPPPSASRVTAESIADKDPERVAQQVRAWMQED